MCNTCNVGFTEMIGLEKHISAVHQKKKPFKCGICDADYGRRSPRNSKKEIQKRWIILLRQRMSLKERSRTSWVVSREKKRSLFYWNMGQSNHAERIKMAQSGFPQKIITYVEDL